MISAHDSIENGGREQGILGPIHVCSRLVNNTRPKKQTPEFFCIFFVSWEPIVCTRSSSEISLSYKIIGIMIRLCNKTILLRKSYGHTVQTLPSVLVHQDFLWMECHAVLFHVPFVKQGELVVVFLLAFTLNSLPDSHHLRHQKLHHRCSVQNLEHYLLRSMKRSQPTRHFRLHLLIQMIQLRFQTFPHCLNLICPEKHSRSFLELPGQEILASLPTFFSNIAKLASHLLTTWQKQNGRKFQAKLGQKSWGCMYGRLVTNSHQPPK